MDAIPAGTRCLIVGIPPSHPERKYNGTECMCNGPYVPKSIMQMIIALGFINPHSVTSLVDGEPCISSRKHLIPIIPPDESAEDLATYKKIVDKLTNDALRLLSHE